MGVAVGDTFISCETEAVLNFERDLPLVASVVSGRDEEYIHGKRRWSISVNGLLLKREAGADFKTLYDAYYDDLELNIQFRTREGIDQFLIFTGTALIKSGSITAPKSGFTNWTIVFQGSGPLGKDWEEFWTIINAMPALSDQPNIVDTRQWGT